jgi:hypothetical protein
MILVSPKSNISKEEDTWESLEVDGRVAFVVVPLVYTQMEVTPKLTEACCGESCECIYTAVGGGSRQRECCDSERY